MLLTYERFRNAKLPIYDTSEGIGAGPGRSVFFSLPGGGARRGNGNNQSPLQERIVRRQGMFLEETLEDLDAVFTALCGEQGRAGRLDARRPDGRPVWAQAELISAQAVREPRKLFRFAEYVALDVDTEFTISSPSWYGKQHGLGWSWDSGAIWDSGIAWEGDATFTLQGGGYFNNCVVSNGGNADVDNAILSITAPAGGMAPPILIITPNPPDTKAHLLYSAPVDAGEVLRIDAGVPKVTNNGIADYDHLTFETPHRIGGWLKLIAGATTPAGVFVPGETTIQIVYTGADGATLKVQFSEAWRG